MANCFVIMPVTTPAQLASEIYKDPDHFSHVLQYLFRPALERAGYNVIPPTAEGADLIHASIIKNLEEADLVLCDISTLNPNVFFELGIRTSLDRPVALVRDNYTQKIPFDTSSINTHAYDASLTTWSVEPEVTKLVTYIAKSVKRANGRNSMWRVFGITQRAEPAEIEDPSAAKLDLLIAQVGRLINQTVISQAQFYPMYADTSTGGVYATGTSIFAMPQGSESATAPRVKDYLEPYGIPAQANSVTHIPFGPDSYTDDATYADLINPVPAKFNNFIEQASTIALGKSASLTIVGYDRKNDSLVLGSGGWQLSEENVEKIDHLSKSLRIKFRLLR
jgi:hypothetical protein